MTRKRYQKAWFPVHKKTKRVNIYIATEARSTAFVEVGLIDNTADWEIQQFYLVPVKKKRGRK